MSDIVTPPQANNKLSFSLDFRIIIFILLAVIAGMLLAWKPWADAANINDRTISVTGEAKITAEPDEYVFNPSYEFKNADKAAALKDLTQKSDDLVSKLKGLGVTDSQIKSNSSGYNYSYYYDSVTRLNTYSLTVAVTLNSRDMAQRVQDYLVTTGPTGQISPQVVFSEAKRKQLESQARDQATKEARAKADQSAKNLGFKVGSVKAVQDGTGFGINYPMMGGVTDSAKSATPAPQLTVQPGQNDLSYSVSVIYFVH